MPVTADTYAPFDSGPGANSMADSWRKFMKGLGSAGVIQDSLLECEVYADSSGLQVKMKPGECWIRGHWAEFVTEKTHPIATPVPSAGQERKDLVVLRCRFNQSKIELDVLQGFQASIGNAVPPAVTENSTLWEIPLAIVTVAAGVVSIAPTAVADNRRYMGQKPLVHRVRSTGLTLAVPPAEGDIHSVAFTPHSDCHIAFALNLITECDGSASGGIAEPSDPVYGVKLRRVSDSATLYTSDKIYRADVIDWNTPQLPGRSTITIVNTPDITLVRNTAYQLVVFGNRSTVLGAQLKHVVGTITECVQNTAP